MATRHGTVTNASDERLHSLAVPLAIGVFLIGAAGTLFKPAFAVGGAPVAAITTPKHAADKAAIAGLPPAERPADDALAMGRSVDAPKLALPSGELERLLQRGRALVTAGDFAAARLLLARAAEGGNADAVFALATTYDPNVLFARGARGLVGEPEQARALYAKAMAAGVEGARQRMNALGG